jgi:hypothetical protein
VLIGLSYQLPSIFLEASLIFIFFIPNEWRLFEELNLLLQVVVEPEVVARLLSLNLEDLMVPLE